MCCYFDEIIKIEDFDFEPNQAKKQGGKGHLPVFSCNFKECAPKTF